MRDEVDVEVLDEGKRNLFRFASRQARIKLIVKHSVMKGQMADQTPEANDEQPSDSAEDDLIEDDLLTRNYDDFDLQSELKAQFDESNEEASILFAVNKILDLMGTQAEVSIQKKESQKTINALFIMWISKAMI